MNIIKGRSGILFLELDFFYYLKTSSDYWRFRELQTLVSNSNLVPLGGPQKKCPKIGEFWGTFILGIYEPVSSAETDRSNRNLHSSMKQYAPSVLVCHKTQSYPVKETATLWLAPELTRHSLQ